MSNHHLQMNTTYLPVRYCVRMMLFSCLSDKHLQMNTIHSSMSCFKNQEDGALFLYVKQLHVNEYHLLISETSNQAGALFLCDTLVSPIDQYSRCHNYSNTQAQIFISGLNSGFNSVLLRKTRFQQTQFKPSLNPVLKPNFHV